MIVILHQDKADDEFQEYKEKVFDEIFYLTDNFGIIKEIINDDEVINIYQEFYDKLGVKNLRFYERVHKDYQEIISQANDLTITSKDNILRNLLVVRYADFYPKELKFENQEQNFIFNLNFILNSNFENFSDVDFIGKIDKLNELFNGFIYFYGIDNWVKLIVENIIYHNINDNLFHDLVSQDRISDKKIQAKITYDELVSELHSFNVKPNFLNRFYKMSLDIIGNENFNNLSFCYNVISSNNQALADDFKEKVEFYIKEFIKNQQRKPDFDDFYPFGVSDYDIFSNFIMNEINNYQPQFDFCDFFLNYDRHSDYNVHVQNKVENITKSELRQVLWLENDKITSRRNFIKSILSNKYFSNDKKEQVRQWIVELLQEKAQQNPDGKVVIEFWLTDTESLTKW